MTHQVKLPRGFWAVLLAGGDGIRLRNLTMRIVGDQRPKQFCPIVGTNTLLSQTRARLNPLVSADRQAFVVSCGHERYYSKKLRDAGESLVVAQPMNRGTAVGMITALLQIMKVDPEVLLGFFPCDHCYSDDDSFRSIVRSATGGAEQYPESLVVVGAEAEYAETDYGWIEPGFAVSETPLYRVNRFWEKPALPQARAFLQSCCLSNTFVTIGTAATFLQLVCSQVPDVVRSLKRALASNDLATTYARLPNVDFSREILSHQAPRLLVLHDSSSGWTDLGSPDRVLSLIAKKVSQPAWFRQSSISLPKARIRAKSGAVKSYASL